MPTERTPGSFATTREIGKMDSSLSSQMTPISSPLKEPRERDLRWGSRVSESSCSLSRKTTAKCCLPRLILRQQPPRKNLQLPQQQLLGFHRQPLLTTMSLAIVTSNMNFAIGAFTLSLNIWDALTITQDFFQTKSSPMTRIAQKFVRQAARRRDLYFLGFNLERNVSVVMRIHQLASEDPKKNATRNVLATKTLSVEDLSG